MSVSRSNEIQKSQNYSLTMARQNGQLIEKDGFSHFHLVLPANFLIFTSDVLIKFRLNLYLPLNVIPISCKCSQYQYQRLFHPCQQASQCERNLILWLLICLRNANINFHPLQWKTNRFQLASTFASAGIGKKKFFRDTTFSRHLTTVN